MIRFLFATETERLNSRHELGTRQTESWRGKSISVATAINAILILILLTIVNINIILV